MEPLFFKAENVHQGVHYAPETSTSMEPLFFKAENLPGLGGIKSTS